MSDERTYQEVLRQTYAKLAHRFSMYSRKRSNPKTKVTAGGQAGFKKNEEE
jgi:hypothetical protein